MGGAIPATTSPAYSLANQPNSASYRVNMSLVSNIGSNTATVAANTVSSGDSFNGSIGVTANPRPAIPKHYLKMMNDQDWRYLGNDTKVRADNDKAPRLLSPESIKRELLNPKRIFKREDGTETILIDPNLFHSLLAQKKRINSGELKFQLPNGVNEVYYLSKPFPRSPSEQAELRLQREWQKSAGLWAAGIDFDRQTLNSTVQENPTASKDFLKVERGRRGLLYSKAYMEIPQSGTSVDRNIMLTNLLDDPREKKADKPYGEYKFSHSLMDASDSFLNEAFNLGLGNSRAGKFRVRNLEDSAVLTETAEANNLLDYRNIPDGHQASGDYRSLRSFATLIVPQNLPGAGGVHDGLESGLTGSFGKVIYPVDSLEKLKDLLHSPLSQRIQISPRGELLRQITSGDKDEQSKVAAALTVVPAKYISIAADAIQQFTQVSENTDGSTTYNAAPSNISLVQKFLKVNFEGNKGTGEYYTTGHPSVGRTYLSVEEQDPFVKEANEIRDTREDPEKKEKKCQEISNLRNTIQVKMSQSNDPGVLAALQATSRLNEINARTYNCN